MSGIHAPRDAREEEDSVATSRDIDQQRNANANANAIPQDEVAQAMAEVAAMEGATNARRADRAGEEALMGAAATEDGFAGFEVTDESGELVMQRFLQFLGDYREQVQVQPSDGDTSNTSNNESGGYSYVYPYAEQAKQLAKRQLARRSIQQEDENDADNAASRQSNTVFSNTIFLDFTHLLANDSELAEAIQTDFIRFEPFLRRAIQTFVLELHPELDDPSNSEPYNELFFVAIHNLPVTFPVRNLRTDKIGQLSSVSGTVTRTSEVRPELLIGSFRCNKCGLLAENVHQQYHFTRPTLCRNPRCKNASSLQFLLETRTSQFVDWQKLRVQENSDEIPPGSMPRSIDVIVRNEMVERAKAGDKCIFTGSLVVIPDGSALARSGEAPRALSRGSTPSDAATGGGGGFSGLKALGVRELTYRTCFVAGSVLQADAIARISSADSSAIANLVFGHQALENHEPSVEEVAMELSTEERAEIRQMQSSPRLYEQMVESIAPSTFGHKEVKKGVLLMLLGGVHKTTADRIKLRGDVNVCIVGDPSTAKSQFLKYVHSFLPTRAVYTSGKASSAAGLTAAVQRDQDTGEYCIEAGALMLADNGICCIDEFDKMDPTDQVAIHEAMEQQTISITKAGIQATLNARASVLAAANPIYGRYDRTKTLKANVALSAPILSRFDLFFVVLDECNPDSDRQVAEHILKVHRCEEDSVRSPFTKDQMQRYIRFARAINPKITPESQKVLVDCYRKLRQGDTLGRSRSAYRITVRQLESMIRLSEALARLHCDQEIQPSYVREAFRLLKTSIIQVETSDVEIDDDDDEQEEGMDGGNGDDGPDSSRHQSRDNDESMEDAEAEEAAHPGEYGTEREESPTGQEGVTETTAASNKSKKKKTQMSYEEYETMSSAIAMYLRSLEEEEDIEGKDLSKMKWGGVVEWYLEQVEHDIGDSVDMLREMRKKVNLVIRRLINVDKILVVVGDNPSSKKEEKHAVLAVHPNYVVS